MLRRDSSIGTNALTTNDVTTNDEAILLFGSSWFGKTLYFVYVFNSGFSPLSPFHSVIVKKIMSGPTAEAKTWIPTYFIINGRHSFGIRQKGNLESLGSVIGNFGERQRRCVRERAVACFIYLGSAPL